MPKTIIAFLLSMFVCFSFNECLADVNEAEKIAVRFTEMILSGDTENMPQVFSMTDEMKARFLQTNSFQEYRATVSSQYGTAIERENTSTNFEENNYYRSLIPYRCKKGTITFDVRIKQVKNQMTVWAFTWIHDPALLNKSSQEDITIVLVLFTGIVVFTIVTFFVMYFGLTGKTSRLRDSNEHEDITNIQNTYRDSQNPAWPYFLWGLSIIPVLILIPVIFFAIGGMDSIGKLHSSVFITNGLIVFVLFAVIWFVGFFTSVSDGKLVVRMGLIKLKVLSVSLDEIESVEVISFCPISDFGGWGLRKGKNGTWGYFMGGDKGVRIVTKKNKKYLIGSDYPNDLAEAIRTRCSQELTTN